MEHAGAPGRTLLVEGAGGGQTWVFGDWVEEADADEGYEDDPCGCVTASFRSSATPSTRPKSPRFGRCRRRGSTFSTRRRGLLGNPQNPRSGAQRDLCERGFGRCGSVGSCDGSAVNSCRDRGVPRPPGWGRALIAARAVTGEDIQLSEIEGQAEQVVRRPRLSVRSR